MSLLSIHGAFLYKINFNNSAKTVKILIFNYFDTILLIYILLGITRYFLSTTIELCYVKNKI